MVRRLLGRELERVAESCQRALLMRFPKPERRHPIEVVAFDGDDTLWFHENVFVQAQREILGIVTSYVSEEVWAREFSRIELANLSVFGYGIKSFALSAIEAAVTITNQRVSAAEIEQIIAISKRMLIENVEVMSGTKEVLENLKKSYRLLLITKGDHIEQFKKVEAAKFVSVFDDIEIVGEKDTGTYERILRRHRVLPQNFVMIGNSVRSDILPVLSVGGWAIHVPSALIWEHENAPVPTDNAQYFVAATLHDVPRAIRQIEIVMQNASKS
jgi:putative hydrolase of the HAD superfamily